MDNSAITDSDMQLPEYELENRGHENRGQTTINFQNYELFCL